MRDNSLMHFQIAALVDGRHLVDRQKEGQQPFTVLHSYHDTTEDLQIMTNHTNHPDNSLHHSRNQVNDDRLTEVPGHPQGQAESLSKLLENYHEIEKTYEQLQNEISMDCRDKTINQSIADLQQLFTQCSQIEEQLLPLLSDVNTGQLGQASQELQEFLQIRKERIGRLVELNKQLTLRSKSVASIISHEMKKLNTGRKVVQGYKPTPKSGRGIIRKQC